MAAEFVTSSTPTNDADAEWRDARSPVHPDKEALSLFIYENIDKPLRAIGCDDMTPERCLARRALWERLRAYICNAIGVSVDILKEAITPFMTASGPRYRPCEHNEWHACIKCLDTHDLFFLCGLYAECEGEEPLDDQVMVSACDEITLRMCEWAACRLDCGWEPAGIAEAAAHLGLPVPCEHRRARLGRGSQAFICANMETH